MSNLLETLLNLLGYYQLSAVDFNYYYGSYYYLPSIQQLSQQVDVSDETLVDVASFEIAQAIQAELNTTADQYEITYDFAPLFVANNTTPLQQKRVMDKTLNNLEKKGYKVYETSIVTQSTIRWRFTTFRMFKRVNVSTPGL